MKKTKSIILSILLFLIFITPQNLQADSLHELYTMDGMKYRGKFVAFKYNTIYFIAYQFGNAKKQLRLHISKIWKLVINPDKKDNINSTFELEDKYKKLRKGKSLRQYTLSSKVMWLKTRINIKKGQQILFAISGKIKIDKNTNIDHTGEQTTNWNKNKPLPTYPTGSVIGKIGESLPFYIGNNKAPFIAENDGVLYLGINDYSFNNNEGSFIVSVYH
jgi:hypothetical protein